MNDLYTPETAAKKLDCTPRTVRRRCANGQIDAQKLGGVWLIRREEIKKTQSEEKERVPA